MNKDQLAQTARHRKVKQTLADFAADVAAVPALDRLAATYLAQLALLDSTARKNPITSQGITLTKNNAGTALIARLVHAANALYLLYKAEGNLEDAAKMHRSPSDYRDLPELVLATEAIDLSTRLSARAQDLTDYNVTAADVEALAADAQSFDHFLPAPQLAIDANKLKGAAASATLRTLNTYLKDDLYAGVLFRLQPQPAFGRRAAPAHQRQRGPHHPLGMGFNA
ncbi:hypothetical protein [Hymenobacter terricola]|uniref:hypothetical protein n=1 Tax=Hymenobacter terricola TaxID=2819236 RepID=UPI001B314609|nr:hypothetical protein [Hymenobacter terricola]